MKGLDTYPGLLLAGSQAGRNMLIAPQLARFIRLHLLRHMSGLASQQHCARYAVIQGPPGGGKTASIEKVVTDLGWDLYTIPASRLSGETEGEPSRNLAQDEASVREISARTGRPIAVKHDDADLSVIGASANVQYTVNTQLTQHELMSIADDRRRWTTASGMPIPMFVTCNDATVFRGSQFRDGRGQFFTHMVSREDKSRIVAAMLEIRNIAEARRLVAEHPDAPVSYFATLKMRALDEDLERLALNAVRAALLPVNYSREFRTIPV